MDCPDCKEKLNGNGYNYNCPKCGAHWEITFTCEKCKSVPTMMSSCGSLSFFCENCKALKSREAMDKTFKKKD